jgi:hypothetical protein
MQQLFGHYTEPVKFVEVAVLRLFIQLLTSKKQPTTRKTRTLTVEPIGSTFLKIQSPDL